MATLERAIEIAVSAHKAQKDKGHHPYILHPLRIMLKMPSSETMIAAMLHDVVEDSEWTLAMLSREGFSKAIIELVDCLTRRKNENYEAYLERLQKNPTAIQIKLGDLEDNMNIQRLSDLSENDFKRLQRYYKAYCLLKDL